MGRDNLSQITGTSVEAEDQARYVEYESANGGQRDRENRQQA